MCGYLLGIVIERSPLSASARKSAVPSSTLILTSRASVLVTSALISNCAEAPSVTSFDSAMTETPLGVSWHLQFLLMHYHWCHRLNNRNSVTLNTWIVCINFNISRLPNHPTSTLPLAGLVAKDSMCFVVREVFAGMMIVLPGLSIKKFPTWICEILTSKSSASSGSAVNSNCNSITFSNISIIHSQPPQSLMVRKDLHFQQSRRLSPVKITELLASLPDKVIVKDSSSSYNSSSDIGTETVWVFSPLSTNSCDPEVSV